MTQDEFKQLRPGERLITRSTIDNIPIDRKFGKRGTVTRVNDNHTIHVRWDNGDHTTFERPESSIFFAALAPKPNRRAKISYSEMWKTLEKLRDLPEPSFVNITYPEADGPFCSVEHKDLFAVPVIFTPINGRRDQFEVKLDSPQPQGKAYNIRVRNVTGETNG